MYGNKAPSTTPIFMLTTTLELQRAYCGKNFSQITIMSSSVVCLRLHLVYSCLPAWLSILGWRPERSCRDGSRISQDMLPFNVLSTLVVLLHSSGNRSKSLMMFLLWVTSLRVEKGCIFNTLAKCFSLALYSPVSSPSAAAGVWWECRPWGRPLQSYQSADTCSGHLLFFLFSSASLHLIQEGSDIGLQLCSKVRC